MALDKIQRRFGAGDAPIPKDVEPLPRHDPYAPPKTTFNAPLGTRPIFTGKPEVPADLLDRLEDDLNDDKEDGLDVVADLMLSLTFGEKMELSDGIAEILGKMMQASDGKIGGYMVALSIHEWSKKRLGRDGGDKKTAVGGETEAGKTGTGRATGSSDDIAGIGEAIKEKLNPLAARFD